MRTHTQRALQSPEKTDLGFLLMKGFFPAGYTPALSSGPSRTGSWCTVHSLHSVPPHQHPSQEENQNLLYPGLSMTTGNSWLRRQRPGQLVFALSQSVQLSFLPAGVSFLCQLQPLSAPGMGPASGAVPSAWPSAWTSAQKLSSVCTGCLPLQWPALQSSPWNSGMRNIHPCHFSKPTQKLLHALVRGMGPVWLHALAE